VGDHASEALAGKPCTEIEGRRFDSENLRPAWFEFKRYRLLTGRADARRNACEDRLRGTMRVPRRDQQHARTIENRGERVGVPIRPATDW
jgi:hypothetical protein